MIDLATIKADNAFRQEIRRRDPKILRCWNNEAEDEIDFLLAEIERLRLLARDVLTCEEILALHGERDKER